MTIPSPPPDLRVEAPANVEVRFATSDAGDLAPPGLGGHSAVDGDALSRRRRALCTFPWTWLRQDHGTTVRVVVAPGDHAGTVGDAAITMTAGAALSVVTADCAPVVLWSDDGRVVGVVHAGWRGLAAGVLVRTVDAMRGLVTDTGDLAISGALGPCIHPCCYEFGAELDSLVDQLGPDVASTTRAGMPSLDVPEAVSVSLAGVGVHIDREPSRCTGCTDGLFSYRARRDAGRQATVIWKSS